MPSRTDASEQELITRYKSEMYPLTFVDDPKLGRIPKITVHSLTRGVAEEVKDITILLSNEEVIKDACKNFRVLLDVMATFGGEEVVEFGSTERKPEVLENAIGQSA